MALSVSVFQLDSGLRAATVPVRGLRRPLWLAASDCGNLHLWLCSAHGEPLLFAFVLWDLARSKSLPDPSPDKKHNAHYTCKRTRTRVAMLSEVRSTTNNRRQRNQGRPTHARGEARSTTNNRRQQSRLRATTIE